MKLDRTQIALAIIAALALVIAATWAWNSFQGAQGVKTRTNLEHDQGAAFQNSTVDAIGTQGNVTANAQATEKTGDENERTIRAAPGADQPLSRDLNRAARGGMCHYRSNRNKPECRVQQAPPR